MIQISSRGYDYFAQIKNSSEINFALSNYDICVVDANVIKSGWLQNLEVPIFEILPAEGKKNLDSVQLLLEKFASVGLNRKSRVICIGGGVLQDLCTLVCSLYMRGIDWDFVPSTLQAMGDSCVGGKSSVNLGTRKNVIGNYFPPKNIFLDTTLIQSLSYQDIQCGLLEILKINMLQTEVELSNFFQLFSQVVGKASKEIDPESLKFLVYTTLQLKAQIVTRDEFDLGERRLLNFGHTFGHAVEEFSNFKIPHGHAVGLGMLLSLQYSNEILGSRTGSRFQQMNNQIKKIFGCESRQKYIEFLKSMKFQEFSAIMLGDKKSVGEHLNLIIPNKDSLEIYTTKYSRDFEISVKKTIDFTILDLEF
jgi:3-dehydroquinate synthase